MFKHLRVKLTVLYAGLFCLVLMLIGATGYIVIADNTVRGAREQIATTSEVFDRVWTLRFDHLQDSAFRTAGSPAFQNAVATHDERAIEAQLADVRRRAGADIAFLVTREGLIVGDRGGGSASVSPGLQVALGREQAPRGVILSRDTLFQATTAPLPLGQGWIVLGAALNDASMESLEQLSSLPLHATTAHKTDDGWVGGEGTDDSAVEQFIDQAIVSSLAPRELQTESGRALALVRPLETLDGTRGILMLRYPMSAALSPYGALFGTLLAIGIAALAMLIAGTWFLARSITQPLSTLEVAAKKLQQGVYETIVVRTKDELFRVAESFNAMTDAIRERERRITSLAYQDAETRLPNRLALERKLAGAQRSERVFLAAIGVDRFAHVRGAIGYALASALVRTLGSRLARLVPNAPVGRLSSDVLGVAFLADNDADARKRAEALVANLEESLSLDGQVVDVNVTIGVAQPRAKGESPAAMIERASIALDQARSAMQKVGVFDEAAYGDPARNLSLMGEMRRALEAGHVTLVHQPKYNFRTGRIDSAESLVRWAHPVRGMIPPDLFVPMAEETGHVRALTEWVLRRAVEDQQRLSAAGFPLTLAVNISARLLSDADFARSAVACVRQAPHTICFEITETAIIDNPKVALENIELFAANGIRIAIDDYGSGLSSLAYLKQLPAQELKIDKAFVQNINVNQRDALLVRSTIDLAHGLGMDVTAEGVETPAAFALLASMRCNLAQGYLISRPCSLEELVAILGDDRRLKYYQQTATTGANPAPPAEIAVKPRTA